MASSLFTDMISRHVDLERTKAGESKRMKKIIKRDVDDKITVLLNQLPENYTNKQLDTTLRQIRKVIDQFYKKSVFIYTADTINKMVNAEVIFLQELLEEYLTDGEVSVPRQSNIRKAAEKTKYQGKTLKTWTVKLGEDKVNRVIKNVKSKATENAPKMELLEEARIQINTSNTNVDAVFGAYISNSVEETRDALYAANDDVVDIIIWSSILDGSTTVTCGLRNGKKYDAKTKKPIGHPHKYGAGPGRIHFGCRSAGIPGTSKGVMLEGPRMGQNIKDAKKRAVGAEDDYERGDDRNKAGKKYKRVTKNNNLEREIVPFDQDYSQWLKQQPRPFVEDKLGVSKASLFLDKNVSLNNFVVEDGTELTVDELVQRTGKKPKQKPSNKSE